MTLAAHIHQAGFHLETDGNNLIIEPFSELTASQIAFLKRHKAEIIAELLAANDGGNRLAIRPCATCGVNTLHQRIEGEWGCTRVHVTNMRPKPEAIDTAARNGPIVECWTPSGECIRVRARDDAHAAWLRKMNPKPAITEPR
ncbi:MAG: hypothetical protein AXA67_02160 [Methylothermaceae bacteria B42]|nr:MAG: hypothetical protein AXA67_02160 [Methylothermaceae bacteria B42]HHJ40066.1 hypothetical protein [Methylothermaceae bacterium]